MTLRTVGTTVGVCLVFAACGGEQPGAKPGGDMPMAAMHGDASTPVTPPTDPRAALFVRKGCPQCHTISALGVKSPAEIGPDLTYAYTDVQNRFNMKLEDFLRNPTGTMQMVLSSQIKLSPEERDSVIHILKQLHENGEDVAEAGKGD